MAETIKGINVVIGAETTGLAKALSDVDKRAKSIQSELKQVERLLKMDPSNTELLAQKQRLLSDAIANTREKLERLRSVQEQVNEQFQRGEISEGQYRAFQREIVKTQQELQRLQDSLRETEQEQQRIASSTKQLETLFKATGTSVDQFADALDSKLVNAIKNGTASSKQLDEAIAKIGQAALGTNVDLDKLKAALASVDDGNSLKNVQKELNKLATEAKAAEKSVEGLGSQLESVAGALVAGGGIAGAIEKALDVTDLEAKINVAFDVPESSKKAIKEAVRSIEAYGVDAEAALEGVRRQWALNKNASDEANTAIVKGAAAITRAYAGIDFTELIQETHEVASELNISNEAALGLINSLLKIGFPPEQLDIIAEYGQQLQRAGFEAEEIQAIFAAGVETGTWNIDNLLDGLKEGRIRLAEFGQEVDKSTKELLQGTNISAKQLQEWGRAVAAGGDKGRQAMQEVTKALMNVKDETKRNALGVAIFGTMWEDQGDNISETILNMNKHLGDAKNNQEQLNQTISEMDESPVVKLQQAFQDLKTASEPLLGIIADIVSKIAEWVSNNPALVATIAAVASAIGIIMGAVMAISPIITAAIGLMGTFGLSIGAIAAPVGIAAAAISGLVAVGALVIANWETIRDTAAQVWGQILQVIGPAVEEVVSFVVEQFDGLAEWWRQIWPDLQQAFVNIWNGIMTFLQPIINAIVALFQWAWPFIQALVVETWENVKNVISSALNIIMGLVNAFAALFTGNWSMLWEAIKQILSNALNLLWNLFQLWGIGKILKFVGYLGGQLGRIFRTIWDEVYGIFKSMLDKVFSIVKSVFDSILSWITGLGTKFFNAGKGLIEQIKKGIEAAVDTVVDSVKKLAQKIRDFLPFSPAKTGPLSDLDKLDFGGPIATSIQRAIPRVQGLLNELLALPSAGINVNVTGNEGFHSVGGAVINMDGLFNGATIVIRNDNDIRLLMQEAWWMAQRFQRGLGGVRG